MHRSTALEDYLHALAREFRGAIRRDALSRVLYSTDASLYQVLPHAVLIPTTVEDVAAAVALAARHQIPLLPRTAGTSLAGQAVNEAVVIDFSRHLDRILEVRPAERWARVEPGVVLDDLNRALAPHALEFGPDPASSNRAGLGGIVANNAAGSHSILHGMTADHVLEVRVLLADGSRAAFGPLEAGALEAKLRGNGREGAIYRAIHELVRDHRETILAGTPRHWRRAGGYNLDRFVEGATFLRPRDPRFNLAQLVCGSEGTLAVITEVKVALVPRAVLTALAIVQFADRTSALAAVPAILETGPAAVEFMDRVALARTRAAPAWAPRLARFVDGAAGGLLITEFRGEREDELGARIEELRRRLVRAAAGARVQVRPILAAAQQAEVWAVRRAGLGLLMGLKGDRKPIPFIEDAAVPVEHLCDYVARLERFCEELGTSVACYAHASAGCLHIRPIIDTKAAAEVARLPAITRHAIELLHGYGGALSSEHGAGRARSPFQEAFFGRPLVDLFRRVKGAFDPEGRLNPGNIVDPPPATAHLRYGPTYRTRPVEAALDFADDGGLVRAIELCNGAGACRKRDAGVMCPSFRVTREEEHSTRGRANALRAALSGRLPGGLSDPQLHEAMALCIGCKACKSECASEVDMARIKVEFLAQHYRRHRVPLRARIFAGAAVLGRVAGGWRAPLVNAVLARAAVRWVLDRTLGISRHRPLALFARHPFRRPASRSHVAPAGAGLTEVVLFQDTLHRAHEPQVLAAAVEVLEAAGCAVRFVDHGCCGRAMLSQGLVDAARRAARRVVDALWPFVARGVPVIGLEPSCLLMLRDDYPHLLPGDPRMTRLAEHARLLEEFLLPRLTEERARAVFAPAPGRVLVHGHCHQKALVGTEMLSRLLARVPGLVVEEVDAGCCGMAGAFGYEAEHYEISLRMGEDRLFPAVRAAAPDTVVVAPGASCRQQIRHGTGRPVRHPVEVLRDALARHQA
ncbi:MAG: FAD-binding protein [Planctomycetes bacterium]|nr:FAD-binding protein [Planctomycetota bacterium]